MKEIWDILEEVFIIRNMWEGEGMREIVNVNLR